MSIDNQSRSRKGNTAAKWLIFGGLAFGGWWLWKRRNLGDQLSVSAPRIKGFRGTSLILQLTVTNISDVDVKFHGFLGSFTARENAQSNFTNVAEAVSITSAQGLKIAASAKTEVEVEVSLGLLGAASTIYRLIRQGDASKFEAYLQGNYFVTDAKIKVPYNQRLV
jgi:hypothetical protein